MQNNVVSLTDRLKKRPQVIGTTENIMSNSSDDLKPETCNYFIIEGDTIAYTKKGYPYFKGLFAQACINIKNIESVADHINAEKTCEPFQLEYAVSYGESEDSDLFFKFFAAANNCDFKEAERLQGRLRQQDKLKVVK